MYMTWGQFKEFVEKKLKIKDDEAIAIIDVCTNMLPQIKRTGWLTFIKDSRYYAFDQITNEYIGDH